MMSYVSSGGRSAHSRVVEENQMKANPDKFQGILFGHSEVDTEISLWDTSIIKPSDDVDLFGLTIDSKLNLSKNIKTTTHKASLKLMRLRCLSKWLDPDVRLDYGCTFVQKRLLRNIYEEYEISMMNCF